MTIYDGTAFGAIDATAYEDGRPADTWLRRKTENNVAFLTVSEPPVTVLRKGGDSTPLDGTTTYYVDRAIASWATTVFICQPVWITPTTTHIRMHLCIRSMKAFSTGTVSEVAIGATVRMKDGRVIGALGPAAFDDTQSYEDIGLTTYTIPVVPTGSGFAYVMMTVQSRLDDTNPPEKTQDTSAFVGGGASLTYNFSGGSPKYDPASSPSSTTSYPFDHCVLHNDGTDQHSDVIAFDNEADNIHRFITAASIAPGIGSTMTFMGLRPLSFLQMRSYTVEVVHRYNLRDVELLSGVPDRGIDNLRHAQSTRLLRARPRLIAGGPEGYLPAFRPTIQGRHPQVWTSAFGGPASFAQPVTTVLRCGGIEPLSNGKVKIIMLLHGCAHNAIGIGSVEWELVATVRNWVGTPTTVTATYAITTIGTQSAWSYDPVGGDGATGKRWIPTIQRAAFNILTSEFYAVRDGQFLAGEIKDCTEVIIELDVPDSGANVGYDIEVTAECVGNIENLAIGADAFQYQHLTLVGHAVYLVPNEVA